MRCKCEKRGYLYVEKLESSAPLEKVPWARERRSGQAPQALSARKHTAPASSPLSGLVATSPPMLGILEQIQRAAPFDVPVHIGGESGTGKELVAKAIHGLSSRADRGFVAFNCAAIPDPLLEAELFGHARGAFTGADRCRRGLVDEADGGTLFLDEVADLSPRGQTLLLRVLQDREYRKLGDTVVRRSNFRLVSATHRRLEVDMAAGRFREDLYFRLKVVSIEIPPLRERASDIVPLARHCIRRKASQMGVPEPSLGRQAERALVAYSWPGNVREMENEMVRALLRLGRGRVLEAEHLSPRIQRVEKSPLRFASREFEREYLRDALVRNGGNRTRTARALGLTRQALYVKLRKHGLEARPLGR
ncbi:MAG: sigma-54 interaction domain-containing protein [Acidobacteriota bacterium]